MKKRIVETQSLPSELAARILAALHRSAATTGQQKAVMAEVARRNLSVHLAVVNGCLVARD